MMRSLLIATLFAALPAAAAGAEDGPADAPNVTARLVPIQAAVKPGDTFPVGIHLTMAKGWHVYWKNPGEAGLPTRVEWTLPEGFRPGALQWPVPIRFTMPGDITAFGYADEVVLIALITVPEDLGDRKEVTLKAKVSWLGCNGTCIPGEAEVQATLPVGRAAESAPNALLQRWTARLPVDASSQQSPARVTVSGGSGFPPEGSWTVRLDWRRPVRGVAGFPVPGAALNLSDVAIRSAPGGRRTRITFTARVLKGQTLDRDTMEWVLAYTDANGERRGIRIDVPLPAAKKAKPADP